MIKDASCDLCSAVAPSLFLEGELWLCRQCYRKPDDGLPYFKEMGVENPSDPKGSTAHVRDIKARRLDPSTNKMYYEQPRRTYFFPRG